MGNVILFDLDGTLIDYRDRFYKTYEIALRKFGIKCISKNNLLSLRKNNKLKSSDFLDEYIISKHLKSRKALIKKITKFRKSIIELQKYLKLDKTFPKTKTILKKLHKNNILIIITSRANRIALNKQLKWLDLAIFFDEVFNLNNNRMKRKIIKELKRKYRNEKVFYITDSYSDIVLGKTTGIVTIGILTGINSYQIIKSVKPSYIIKSLEKLPSILNS